MALSRKPVKGDRVRWPDWKPGRVAIVTRVEGNLCWIQDGDVTDPFIWRFPEGLNRLAEIIE